MNIKEINSYLLKQGWRGSFICTLGGKDSYEVRQWNSRATPELSYAWLVSHRDSLFNSVKAEYQAKHSAISNSGASAYGDKWL